MKKLAEPKLEIKARVGSSPDIADGLVLAFARPVLERLPDNDMHTDPMNKGIGKGAYQMPDHEPSYQEDDAYDNLYD